MFRDFMMAASSGRGSVEELVYLSLRFAQVDVLVVCCVHCYL